MEQDDEVRTEIEQPTKLKMANDDQHMYCQMIVKEEQSGDYFRLVPPHYVLSVGPLLMPILFH